MRITLGENNFNDVKDFTTHLEGTYEQNKLISEEVTLSVECDAFSQEHFDELVAFLLSPERTRLYKFKFPPEQAQYQLAFDDAYLLSKRQRFSLEFHEQISELVSFPISFQPHTPKIRKAKKNWGEDIGNSSIGLQFQYHIPHEHQHQQRKATQRKRKNNEEPQYQHPEISPLVLIPEVSQENARHIVGSYHQFSLLKKDSELIEHYKTEFDHLLGTKSSSEQRQAAFIFFISKLTENNASKLKLIKNLLQAVPLSDLNYQGLAHALIHTGADGVLLLLQQIKTLHDKEFFKEFETLFLDKPENYLALMSPQGLVNLKKLSELTSEQKTWWVTLVAQHKATGANTEFNDLFVAYNYFLDELEKKKLKLPFSCTLKNIQKLEPTLNCLLFIINNSSDPQEQLTYLDGIDVYAAYHASRNNNYKLVSRQMNLKLKVDEVAPDFSTPTATRDVSAWLNRFDCSYAEIATRFYRFIGTQEWAFSLDVYQNIEHEIRKNNKLNDQNKVLLLNIVALLATGQRACTHMEYPDTSIKKLLNKFIALAEQFGEDLQNELSTVIPVLAESLAHLDWESMPTADELHTLIDIILHMQKAKALAPELASHDFQEVAALALHFMGEYSNAASLVIDHYKRRLAMEQTNTVPIRNFSYSELLNHLVSPSKLDKFLPELFHDQPKVLSQFVVLCSLLSDEIPKVTQHDAEDSEFEAKIKMLAHAVHDMQDERRGPLLAILTDINIEASYRLPTLEQLIKVVDVVRKAAFTEVEDQKVSILEMVHAELPELKIGKEAVHEATIDLFSLMRQSYEEWQLENKLGDLPAKIKSYLEPWMDAHNIVLYYLKKQPINPQTIFDSLADEEQEVKNLLGSRMFSWALSGFPQAKIKIAEVLGNEFFPKQTFMPALQTRVKVSLQSTLSTVLKSLQTSNKDFDDFLLNQIEGLDTDLAIDEAFLEWKEQLDDVNGLINSLIRIKNKNSIEFRRCISLLAEEIKPTLPGKNVLSIVQMRELLNTLSQDEPLSVASPLAILCKILKDAPGYSAKQLHNVLNEVAYLSKYRATLEQEEYETLLRWSCTYNLTQNSLFPLKEIIGLKSLAGVDEKQSEALFHAFMHVIKNVGPGVDEQLLKTIVNKITSIIQVKAEVQSLIPLLILLMKACSNGKEAMLLNLIDRFEGINDFDLNIWSKILLISGEHTPDESLHRLFDVHAGLELNQHNLKKLEKLFNSPPYPEMETFIHVLNGYENDLMAYIDAFDKDPKSGRAPQKNEFGIIVKDTDQVLDEQFDMSQIARVIGTIQDSVEGTPLSSQEQYDLAQQITFINAIGRSKPFTLVVGNNPETKRIIKYADLTQISRAELYELFDILVKAIRKPGLDAHEKLKDQLRLLAVLREQYFRTTGTFADTTQLISVLTSLKSQHNNMLMEVDTEEADVTASLLAVMQWVEAAGGTVDVCIDNREAVIQADKNKGTKDFLTSLGIDSSSIRADSPKGTYQIGGINYSTVGDLALYRSRAKVENENLVAYKDGHPLSSNLILCGSDFSKLDQRTLYHLVQDDENHSYAWVYPLINEFVAQRKFKTLHPGKVWSESQDVDRLKEFLDRHAPTGRQKAQLNSLTEKFSLWINAAIEAQRLVEGEDFDILPSETALHVAIPSKQKASQGFTFLVHQFLHARLQRENPEWEFVIEPEKRFIDSSSTKDLIDDYKQQGRIIGISKTLSKKDGLAEQCSKFGMNDKFKIPSHQDSKRNEFAIKSSAEKQSHVGAIKEAIQQAEDGQPIVLIAKDASEVKLLERELKAHFSKNIITALTGAEPLKEREHWIKNKSGQKNTITIITLPSQDDIFDTNHPKGFLSIQTSLDTPSNTRLMIHSVARNNDLGKHIALYEECGKFFLQSWYYQSLHDCQALLDELTQLQRKQNKAAAVERHYTRKVSEVQHVVLQQFQEWKEFLHLVYPKSEWRTLDAELLKQREDLILDLDEKWAECLRYSDPQNKYPNPYVRWDAKQQVQTEELDEMVQAYEDAVNPIWDQKRAFLKEKAKQVLSEGSINDLRCEYLDGVSLSEQLKLSRLAERENKKEMRVEKKKAHRYILSALDVNGAMLRFADGDVAAYKVEFAKNQVKLFAEDIRRIIGNNPYLNKSVRSTLLDQVAHAENLGNLVTFLRDYAVKHLPEDSFAEKYAMQPVIHELLRVYQQAGLKETKELKNLQTIYFDRVVVELVDELESSLSWAMEKNRGLGYWLERSAVNAAAEAILVAVQQLKNAKDFKEKKIAIRNLYKVLAEHELQLEGVWIFPFWGHKNTSTLIKNTLATLNGLTAIGSGVNELDADFIHDCKEESLYEVMKERLNSSVEILEDEDPSLEKNNEWKEIRKTLIAMQTENNTIYAFHEMYYFLSNKVEEFARKHSPLQEHVAHLRGKVRMLFETFSQDHRELLNSNKYLTRKAENLQNELNGLNGFNVKHVKLKEGHNGFSDYFDLVIEGSGSHPLFHDFSQYNSRALELTEEREALELRLSQTKLQLISLNLLIKDQLPLLKFNGKTKAVVAQFPAQFQKQVNDILVLKEWVADQRPDDLSSFPEKVRDSFLDRELVKTFKFPELKAEEIEQIHDVMLRIGFKDLHERIVEGMKKKSAFGTVYSYVSSYVFTPENMDDWRLDFDELVNRPTANLEKAFRPDIEKAQSELASQLNQLHQKTADQIESLKQQIIFLNEKVAEEERKSGVYVKRMTHVEELFEFEQQLMTFKANQPEVDLLPQENLGHVVPHEMRSPVTQEVVGLVI
ncbi:LigA, interaptin [Legionella steigerwaltii]|uniref:LigA, interaptin n=1 Tax=Legionella steigerwaltii TaxID=460 RepID=A0A378LAM4_9GAMM|nr:hypothetical protein [Legionella steigerwaltii]KTD75735.1 LigA, interaptin [Legionella steigerwaltii]STY23754.1 LigA, interaptin [Legionella steigerwaltii]